MDNSKSMYDFATETIEIRIKKAEADFPGFKIIPKSTSFLMRALYALSFMFIWNPSFMEKYISTVGFTIYTPFPFKGPNGLAVLDHELQHIADSKGHPVLWKLGYMFPQCLVLLAFGAFWSPWFLLALLALGPWPAPFRVSAEYRAYRKQLITMRNYGIKVDERQLVWLKEQFCGWGYWRMSWTWFGLQEKFRQVIDPTAVLRS